MFSELSRGREAFDRGEWSDAYALLSAAEPLATPDVERLAQAAVLVGRDRESTDLWTRAYREWVARGDIARAVRAVFWLTFGLLNRGEQVLAGGWIDTARRLLADVDPEQVEHGLMSYLNGLRHTFSGDAAAGAAAFATASDIGEKAGDVELTTLARIGLGRCRIYQSQIAGGLALLDEAMVAVTAGGLSPVLVGDAYCTVIEGCWEVFELRRSQTWTEALSRWCDSQPTMVPYRGQCQVHRAEILRLRGQWDEAMAEAERACAWLTERRGEPAAGAAFYEKAELHRLRGEVSEAESAYREASRWGSEPQPGLARLRLTQGRLDVAVAAIRRALAETDEPVSRSRLLPACVDIMLAADDVAVAREACEELADIAGTFRSDMLTAVTASAEGAVTLADGDAQAALGPLRRAAQLWQDLDVPYERARVRVLLGRACGALGDSDAAEFERTAAQDVFTRLGATSDLAPLGDARGLTPREREVLRLLSTGETNKAIAAKLVLSERTIDRHVSNILAKLGVQSRAAATAYAYEHGLVG
ncbi:LuxR C-terminal-related transcriptional regulator [Haloechinothrix salitolerans]|uniref:LuxR C-terminal-related transcriptional regulator n=1 Tax=Haloechinothrix salitolerans TaxID=926830 RepID=A0ABW2C9G5_9PSEU